MKWASLATAVVIATLSSLADAQSSPTAQAHNGIFTGTRSSITNPTATAVNKFLGMPYAKKPDRFSPAVEADTSSANIKATSFGNACIKIQNSDINFLNIIDGPRAAESEDCLFINVYAPAGATKDSKLPVMFWVYGGSFKSGDGSVPVYDGSYLAGSQGVIVVTFNYRLAMLGFPVDIPGLPTNERNLGILDTKLALAWTKRNIAAFGGDPARITAFGESVGAAMIDLIALTSSENDPPFQAMIMESGSYYLPRWGAGVVAPITTGTGGDPSSAPVAKSLGCEWNNTVLNCLRKDSLTTADYKRALNDGNNGAFGAWSPIDDGGLTVPANYNGHGVRTGKRGAKIPMLTGTNANEAITFAYFDYLFGINLTWRNFFDGRFPELKQFGDEANITKAYAFINRESVDARGHTREWFQATQAITDYMYTCLSAREARANTDAGVKTWRYIYNTSSSLGQDLFHDPSPHGYELPQVFGTYNPSGALNQQKKISAVIMKAWADFAKDPHGTGPGWDAYSGSNEPVAHLGADRSAGVLAVRPSSETDKVCALFQRAYDNKDPPATNKRKRHFVA